MTTHMQHHPSTFTALSSPGPLLWMPLDEVRQAWANFGAEALSCHALLATSSAFAALTWETSALQHHRMAYHAQQGGFPQEAAAHWLDQVVLDLSEAVRNWQCVQLCLERLVASSSDTAQAHTEPVEQVRALSEQAAAQHQRLLHLIGQVQHEEDCGGGQAPATAEAQEQEEE